MSFSEKVTKPAYSPIRDDEFSDSARESDELLHDGYRTAYPRRTSHKRQALFIIAGLVALLASSIVLTTVTSIWWKKERVHGANVIDSECHARSPASACSPHNCSSNSELHRIRANVLQDDRDI